MTTTKGLPILVGADGSECSLEAVRTAAAEAALWRRPLRIVHAFIWPTVRVAVPPGAIRPSVTELRHAAESVLAEAADEAHKAAPEVPVETAVVDGSAVPVLLHDSWDADLLVLGDRGLGGFGSLVLGSVAVHCVAHAACPVLVVRGERRTEGPVVVGVDGSPASAAALECAAAEAERRGAELVVLHAWLHPVSAGPGDPLPLVYDPSIIEDAGRGILVEALAGLAERRPRLDARPELAHGAPGRLLVDRSRAAQLVVVGAHGRGAFAGLLLGSVSQYVIHHAACPVMVARGPAGGR
ncbi:universal stress protein [Spirilliplanes yamanashiensis]|uniref:Universal stress protein n=1 Tax=Spirilliplanes yamanashiensis TaxID=42233 RepID=A0A8J3YF85_9ACTN|nr:universal stress protein [Spirilliplanes yamanashiensis]MDP9818249.1 nucleotide-binding universal stress UspA family protein [Spirilliplanes yamanashiensis]GIJ06667.1 universal stress protein [Spirilliplanes yamanashiensis]